MENPPLSVKSVENNLQIQAPCTATGKYTLETNHTSVLIVTGEIYIYQRIPKVKCLKYWIKWLKRTLLKLTFLADDLSSDSTWSSISRPIALSSWQNNNNNNRLLPFNIRQLTLLSGFQTRLSEKQKSQFRIILNEV